MSIKKNIKALWDKQCLPDTKDMVLVAIANDGRCAASTILSARQRYFYDKNIGDDEAPVILQIMHNALMEQNKRTEKAVSA